MAKPIPLFRGTITKGHFYPHDKRFKDYVQNLEGKEVEVTVERYKKSRTLNQNSYYWLILGIISDDTGLDTDELHQIFKLKYLKYQRAWRNKMHTFVRSTTTLTTLEFMEYIDRIILFSAQELNISIPPADTLRM